MDTPFEEKLPEIKIPLAGKDFYVTRDNTALYTYIGRFAMYDHVHFAFSEHTGGAAFKELSPAQFDAFNTLIREYDFPQHLNLRSPLDCDISAFETLAKNITDSEFSEGVPAEWME